MIGDCKYGIVANFIAAQQQGLTTHLADMATVQRQSKKSPLFAPEAFTYEEATDTYLCPAGQRLHRSGYDRSEQLWKYIGRTRVCRSCPLREACTEGQRGRALKRYDQQPLVDAGRAQSRSEAGQADRKRRQYWMEGSFADAANNHGLKRSRWRGLWKQVIQNLLIATCQNLRKLGKALLRLWFYLLSLPTALDASATGSFTPADLFSFSRKSYPALI